MCPLEIHAPEGWRIVPRYNGGPTVQTPVVLKPGEERLLYAQNNRLEHSAVNFRGEDNGGFAGTHKVEAGKIFNTEELQKNRWSAKTEGFIVTGT